MVLYLRADPLACAKDACDDRLLVLSHLGRYFHTKKKSSFCRKKKTARNLFFAMSQVFLSRNAEQIYLSQIIRSQEEMCRQFTGV